MFIYKCLFLEGRKVLVYLLSRFSALTGLYQGQNSRREKEVFYVFVHVKPVCSTCASSSVRICVGVTQKDSLPPWSPANICQISAWNQQVWRTTSCIDYSLHLLASEISLKYLSWTWFLSHRTMPLGNLGCCGGTHSPNEQLCENTFAIDQCLRQNSHSWLSSQQSTSQEASFSLSITTKENTHLYK